MKYSRCWRGQETTMSVHLTDDNGKFTGVANLYQEGKGSIGSWIGGAYGIGTEWDTFERAVNSLCVFMIWELQAQGIEDRELDENISHGIARAEVQTEIRAEEYGQEVEIINMLIELEEWHELCQETIRELNPFLIPETGSQLELF
jgi:hypothetical protein